MDSPAEKHTLLGLNAIREPRNAHVYTSFQCPWHTATVPPAGFEHAHRSTGSKLAKEPGLCPRGASFCVACRRAAKMRCLRGACVSARSTTTERFVPASDRNTTQGLVESNHNEPQPAETQTKAHACPTPGEPWVILPPIHSCVRPADHGGKFFVLCFQPVTVPCALCAQVTRASARETMATADSGSARDRHWKSRARRAPCTVQAHSPH